MLSVFMLRVVLLKVVAPAKTFIRLSPRRHNKLSQQKFFIKKSTGRINMGRPVL
jgi:hypothetical protein